VIGGLGIVGRCSAGRWAQLIGCGEEFSGLGKKAVASSEWLVARNRWISLYRGLGAVRDWPLQDVQNLEKWALHWWRRVLLFIPVTAVPEAPGGRALDY